MNQSRLNLKRNITKASSAAVFIAILVVSFTVRSDAKELSNLELYYRCYAKIAQKVPEANDPLTVQVKSGKSYVDACIEVLESARLTSGDLRLPTPSTALARRVLGTMHKVHASWFFDKNHEEVGERNANRGVVNLFDVSTPASYYTRALFEPNPDFRKAVTSSDYLRPLRINDNPDVGPAGVNRALSIFGASGVHAGIGELVGFTVPTLATTWPYVNAREDGSGTIKPYSHFGGGILGNSTYFLLSVNATIDFKSDGGIYLPRKWARGVFHDVLCRDLPVVRESDVQSFVVETSNVPFRQSASCVRCHASMDRMASTLRQFRYKNRQGRVGDPPNIGGYFADFYTTSLPAESGWPAVADANYNLRPTNGTLYYRSYTGELINRTVTSIADVGNQLANLDDFYVCAAKRYYEYLTGVSVSLADPGDPATPALTPQQLRHRNLVIDLGLGLKTSRNPRSLIRSILSTSVFRQSDFGI